MQTHGLCQAKLERRSGASRSGLIADCVTELLIQRQDLSLISDNCIWMLKQSSTATVESEAERDEIISNAQSNDVTSSPQAVKTQFSSIFDPGRILLRNFSRQMSKYGSICETSCLNERK